MLVEYQFYKYTYNFEIDKILVKNARELHVTRK